MIPSPSSILTPSHLREKMHPVSPLRSQLPLYPRPYAPANARYINQFLIPCTPLSIEHELRHEVVQVHLDDSLSLYDLCYPAKEDKETILVAAYRVEHYRDGTRAWFTYVPHHIFKIWLRADEIAQIAVQNEEYFGPAARDVVQRGEVKS
jgi:hypothetical protein